ncbi:general secretion pathway protein GspB [bacterium]|nr:general secretion pathway protein GspB [bacterium]MBU1065511.1 general secretion pathway protein GspB [bacterium]MBU1634134.1 general secretion pathway protein GspB [bacterium]MBU1875403.1 general secretion pathway protein GspB [bacterium]
METKKNKIIILIALALSLILLGIFQLSRTGKQEFNAHMVQIVYDQENDFNQVENIIKEILDEGVKEIDASHLDSIAGKYKSFEQLRDPFTFAKAWTPDSKSIIAVKQGKPKVKPENNIPKFLLVGIIFDENNPLAIINGEVYREGDLIEGFRVVRITKDGVKLVSKNNQLYLKAPEFN